jgi:hypothetical protein
VADDWRIEVSDDGEGNRILNSDPLLWTFTDEVNGLTVLDAGWVARATVGERGLRGLGVPVTVGNSGDASLYGNTSSARGAAYLMPLSSVLHLGR